MPEVADDERVFRVWKGRQSHGGALLGSGFAVDGQHIVTCRHVISDRSEDLSGSQTDIWVDGAGLLPEREVQQIYTLPFNAARESDLALLRVGAPLIRERFRYALGAESDLALGTHLILIGFGDPKETARLVQGTVRAYFPQLSTCIVSAGVPRGMSGGPAVSGGRVVGVIKARDFQSGEVDIIPLSFVHELLDYAGLSWKVPDVETPPAPGNVFGRKELISELRTHLLTAQDGATFVLYGLPGVGKTKIAAYIAQDQDVRDHFRNLILWTGVGFQRRPQGFLLSWARSLGQDVYSLAAGTPDLQKRREVLLEALGNRRALLIADDIHSLAEAEQHRLAGRCVNLFTTQEPKVAHGVEGPLRVIKVPELTIAAGLKLLREYAPESVKRYRSIARELVEALGGLPLALTLLGRQLRTAEIGKQPERMKKALLSALEASVPAMLDGVIDNSVKLLSDGARRTLYALSVFRPKPNSFSETAALSVASCTSDDLYELLDSGLVEATGPSRFTIHQTIATFTYRQLEQSLCEKQKAYHRFIRYYVEFTENHRHQIPVLAAEMVNINAAIRYAKEQTGFQRYLVRGANAYSEFLLARGLNEISCEFLTAAFEAAEAAGDRDGQIEAALNRAYCLEKSGKYREADALLARCETPTPTDETSRVRAARAFYVRAVVSYNLCHYQEAMKHVNAGISLLNNGCPILSGTLPRSWAQQGLMIAGALSDLLERRCLISLAINNFKWARDDASFGLRLAGLLEDRIRVAVHLLNLAWLHVEEGSLTRSFKVASTGMTIAVKFKHREYEAGFRHRFGAIAMARLDFEAARREFEKGIEAAKSIGHCWYVALLQSSVGWVKLGLGDYKGALHSFRDGLERAEEIGSTDIAAAAKIGLAFSRRRTQLRIGSSLQRPAIGMPVIVDKRADANIKSGTIG